MSGEALALTVELAKLKQKHGIVPAPFTPLPPLPQVDGDTFIEGYASPATVDRERTKFAAACWMPFKTVPLLYRHDASQPAGEILEIRTDYKGLFVRARVSHSAAKCAPYFSVAANGSLYGNCAMPTTVTRPTLW